MFPQKIDREEFKKWVLKNGGVEESEDNQWLVWRVRTKFGIMKAYRKKNGVENWRLFRALDEMYPQDVDLTPIPNW